jgi:1-deoxy-D-xylulose-5-phosphate synthase
MVRPDIAIARGKPDAMYEQAGLTAAGIVRTVLGALGRETLDDASRRA